MSWTKEELDAYDARGIYIQDERGRIEYALEEGKKIGLDEGKKIGLDEGKKIGLDEGKKIGFDEGKFNEKRTIALIMLKEGMNPETISRVTGLTVDEIISLS
ncbi:MAG: hypothetical protein GTO45_23420 [Candidatus Aminicenantes bacterium]|nr:hypothetical protein [Candidatus Aminicenantes bacterium]NIM81708.1 hypothetical protein [Candidatus Aminicenantes bacterium]NIN21079.1 hypothetical protein [Candidatus Aminicenantes bacterium]NIN44901.1 hypothetical protein [Candidatus Aminicenantes bacterium]NIN87715.1 hypothetical protein [Candidatus Aminicenantes bacterium]